MKITIFSALIFGFLFNANAEVYKSRYLDISAQSIDYRVEQKSQLLKAQVGERMDDGTLHNGLEELAIYWEFSKYCDSLANSKTEKAELDMLNTLKNIDGQFFASGICVLKKK